MPVRACEFDVDSEDDSDQEFRWIRENMFNQINEFTGQLKKITNLTLKGKGFFNL